MDDLITFLHDRWDAREHDLDTEEGIAEATRYGGWTAPAWHAVDRPGASTAIFAEDCELHTGDIDRSAAKRALLDECLRTLEHEDYGRRMERTVEDLTPAFLATRATQPHIMAFRRFKAHYTSIWCSCGWSIPSAIKVVKRAAIAKIWSKHVTLEGQGEWRT